MKVISPLIVVMLASVSSAAMTVMAEVKTKHAHLPYTEATRQAIHKIKV
jgi:hypothetical protein